MGAARARDGTCRKHPFTSDLRTDLAVHKTEKALVPDERLLRQIENHYQSAVILPTFLAASFYVYVENKRSLRDFGDPGRPLDVGRAPARTCSDG